MSDYDPYGDARKPEAESVAVYDPYGDARKPDPEPDEKPSRQRTDHRADRDEKRASAPRSRSEQAKAVATTVRTRLAQVVWFVSVVAAVILGLGALCVALKANVDNSAVRFILDTANKLDLGIFERTKDGVYHATGNTHAAHTKNAVVNWGLAALVWLVGGGILATLIKPKAPKAARRPA